MTDGTRSIECDAVELLLFELRDRELDARSTEAVRIHLVGCTRCRRTQAWDARLPKILSLKPLPLPPTGLIVEVRRRVWNRRRRWLASLAIAVGLTVCATLAALQPWVVKNEIRDVVLSHHTSPSVATDDDFPEIVTLFEPPPVDSLDVLGRQQNGYVAVLRRAGKE